LFSLPQQTFKMLLGDRKHHLPARETGTRNSPQKKRQRVVEPPKEAAASIAIHFVPDIASSTSLSENEDDADYGDQSDENDEYDSDGDSSAASE